MRRIGVYILTTRAPVRIEAIHARRVPPRSEITVGQDYSQRLPATKDYDLFVSNAGPVGQAFAVPAGDCYRLQVDAAFDDGNSWELACFLAHALARHGRFAAAGDDVDEIILASGRVDLAFDVGAVEHLKLKLDAARETIAGWHGQDVPVTLMLPAASADGASAADGAETVFCADVVALMDHVGLPWKAPKVSAARPLIRRLTRPKRWAAAVLGIVALAIVGLGYGLTSRDAAMESHATDLLEGLDAHAQERTLRLAMLPFRDLDFPIDADFADGIIAALERELLRRGRHEIVARDTIDAILADTAHREGGSFQYALIPNLLARAPEIDVVIRGRLRLSKSEPELSFQAIDRNGKLVAASGGQSITLRPCPADAVCAARTLDQIIDSSSRTFHAQAPELHTLTLGGVRYQDSGPQPPFARYLQQRLVDALRLRYADAGTTLAIGEFDSAAPPTEPGTEMVLTGVYWAFVDLIDLRLALTELDGSALVWRGQLRRDGFNQANLLPPRDLRRLENFDGLGPIAFQLTSDRGADPVYWIGEEIDLIMRTDREAWVYCFYAQADGKVLQNFPNPAFWKRASEPRLDPGKEHRVPGDSTYPFDLVLAEPTGLEMIKCFAVSRDVTDELPVALQGRVWAPIDPAVAARMPDIFRDLPNAAISEASMVVTVMSLSDL